MQEHPTSHASASIFDVFSTSDFMPHGHCYLWKTPLVALHVSSDMLIGTAYVVIALTLWLLVRKIRIPFSPMILAFGTFIGACGLTHYMEVWTLWTPDYWLSGFVKLVTAAASVATGAYLVQLRPAINKVATSAQLAEERRIELETQTRELERLYQQVKDLDDARVRFFANVSHELRTPLALVIGTVERLSRGATGEAKRDLEVARRNARVLLRHVNDLLDVARIEEGRMPARYMRADLAELARGTAAQFEVAAVERHVDLTVDAPLALEAELDPEKIQRVLANLLGNAFKFVPDGGRVRIAVQQDRGLARVVVEDSGPGVPPALRSQIFERFRQDETGAARTGGTGLGLSIAKELVELHLGTIAVDEGQWGGARFTFTLPLRAPEGTAVGDEKRVAMRAGVRSIADESAAAAAIQRAGPSAGAAPASAPGVLVVDDNPEMARFVGDVLGAEFRVSFAVDGNEGLHTAEALRPDAVVSDLMMPRAGGDVLLAGMRARPALATTPVLVLTAREDEDLRARMLREGAQDYVAKPFSAEELLARVRNLVTMKRSRDVLEEEVAARGRDLEEVARELTQRKRELERALDTAQVAREQAERASKVKSLFLGMTSHELRTPLTSLRLSIQSLKSGREPLTPRQRDATDRMDHSARRLLALVETLLEYTRVESGRLTVRPERFDVVALARDVVDEVMPQAQKRLLSLEVAPATQAPDAIESDPRLVRLVLVNLVVNAVKYTEQGTVTVAIGRLGAGAWIEVRDTGPGIAPRDLARVFEPYEQVGDAGRSASGVGFGLSLVRGIVEALGAMITVDSEVGRGSVFRVELPDRPPERAVSAEPERDEDEGGDVEA
ncbi:MAG TPA: ATP-binding protein [Anaeromyxobacteraceae bacterium]|nr:ATP-binding protein [Anaeromyxobacteraceae bacterium]